jgi:hypothetical protein
MKKNKSTDSTSIYSYEVIMLVHIIADDEIKAREQLDEKGGIMTKRDVTLMNSVKLYGEKDN